MKTLTGRIFILGPFPVKICKYRKVPKVDKSGNISIVEEAYLTPLGRKETHIFPEQVHSQPVIRTHFPKD